MQEAKSKGRHCGPGKLLDRPLQLYRRRSTEQSSAGPGMCVRKRACEPVRVLRLIDPVCVLRLLFSFLQGTAPKRAGHGLLCLLLQ